MTKILVIDDNRNNLVLLEALLKNSYPDYEILIAKSGPEGIEIAKKELPDAIILDVRMPDMDGYEVCKNLQSYEYTRYIPVLLLTAYQSDSKDVIRGLEFGALSFLTKPINKDILIAHVNVALRITRAEKLLRESKAEMQSLLAEHEQVEKVLKKRINELEKFNKPTVDREIQLVELKKEINELLEKAGMEKKY
jgi:response regulator RpfG family c-di-GMP phosphodiesterase